VRWEHERRLLEEDHAYTQRQLSGLVALMTIAEPETVVVPFSGPMVRLRYTGPLERVYESPDDVSGEVVPAGRAGKFGALLRSDKMLRNALYIVLNSGLQAALGFGFWIITARIFSTENVGRASTLISATGLLSFLGLLGLNTTFIRYLPVAASRNRLMTAGITVTAACSGLAALIYVFLTPTIAPSVSFIAHSAPLALGFVLITAAAAVNILTDSIFISVGKSSYNAVVDGAIGGSFRILLLVVLAGGGAFTVFGIASAGYVAAAVAALLLMTRVLRWRIDFGGFWQVLRPVLKFSGANYVGSILNLLPSLVVPLIVINRLGASGAAYYYVAFQLAALLYTATSAVEQAFLAEGAGSQGMNKAVILRSLRILLAFCVPSFLIILFFGHYALLAFGPQYSAHAQGCLIALAAAVLPIAADNWFLTVLRLSNRLKAIVWSNGVYGGVVIVLAWVLAPHGLTAVALSWPIGSSAGALVAGVAAIGALRRKRDERSENSPASVRSHNRLLTRY
jgi:O-antigen/teichoic acid export membrane protein